MKANPETVKRWKQANRERSRELNRKSYWKIGKLTRYQRETEKEKRIYENHATIFTSSSNGLHISNS